MTLAALENVTYEEARAEHTWNVPERYNIAQDVCTRARSSRWSGRTGRATNGA